MVWYEPGYHTLSLRILLKWHKENSLFVPKAAFEGSRIYHDTIVDYTSNEKIVARQKGNKSST
jgi:hypothetical protein